MFNLRSILGTLLNSSVTERFKEPSTYAGLSVLATTLLGISPEGSEAIVLAITSVLAAASILMRERGSSIKEREDVRVKIR